MSTPDLLPVLSRGMHPSADQGGCFMEVASLLAGEPWSDRPAAVQPALGVVARAVNDLTSDAARPALAPLIPAVIGTAAAGPRTTAELVQATCRRALAAASDLDCRRLRVAAARAERMARGADDPGWWRQRLVGGYLTGPGSRALRASAVTIARTAGRHSDAALYALLWEAVTLARRAAGLADACTDEADVDLSGLLAIAANAH